MIDYGTNVTHYDVSGNSQYYTQIGHHCYWIDGDSGSHIIAHDLSLSPEIKPTLITIAHNVSNEGCLTQ